MKTIRYLAAALAAVLLLAAVGCGAKKPAGSLFYRSSGIDPAETLLAVNGRAVSAEEYLYWLAYECENLTALRGDIKWDEVIEDDVTYAEYAKRSAVNDVMKYAIVRNIMDNDGLKLSQEEKDQLKADKAADVERSGGTEAYLQRLAKLGISEEAYDYINEGYALLKHLTELSGHKGSPVYPAERTLEEYIKNFNYMTVRLIALPTADLDEAALAAQKATLQDCAEQIRAAEDPCAKLAELSKGLSQTDGEVDQTLNSYFADPVLMSAVTGLEEGQVSDVITTANAMCVVLRRPLDESAVARDLFSAQLESIRTSVKVEVSEGYKALDAGKFYPALLELRQTLFEEPKKDG